MFFLLLPACPLLDEVTGDDSSEDTSDEARIVLEGLEAFGPVRSMIWTEYASASDVWLFEDGELSSYGSRVFHTQVSWYGTEMSCADAKAAWRALEAASLALLDASNDGADAAAACEAVPALLAGEDGSTNRASLTWCAGETCDDPLAPGTYPIADDADPYMGAAVSSPTGDSDADAWDAEACAFDPDWAGRTTRYVVSTGTAEFDEVESGKGTSGHVEGELVDDAGVAVGTLAADFDAAWCELPAISAVVFVE